MRQPQSLLLDLLAPVDFLGIWGFEHFDDTGKNELRLFPGDGLMQAKAAIFKSKIQHFLLVFKVLAGNKYLSQQISG